MRTGTTAPSGSRHQLQTPQAGATESRPNRDLVNTGRTRRDRRIDQSRWSVASIVEGTVIDTVLANRLDRNSAAPVNCLVTNPVYSHSGQHVVISAGARVLGETRAVQSLGETRLAVAFHRLLMPDGRTHSLDQFLGLNQIGDAGLRDRTITTCRRSALPVPSDSSAGWRAWLGTAASQVGREIGQSSSPAARRMRLRKRVCR